MNKQITTNYRFPAHLEIHGDDFNFEIEINFEMAGKIIDYVASTRDSIADMKLFSKYVSPNPQTQDK